MGDVFARRPYLVATALGVLYAYVGNPISAIYDVANPLDIWLFSTFALDGQTLVYYTAMYSHQLAVKVLIFLPFAYFTSRISPEKSWKYVWVAVAAILAISLWRLLTPPIELELEFVQLARFFFISALMTTVAFVVAYSVVIKLRRRDNIV